MVDSPKPPLQRLPSPHFPSISPTSMIAPSPSSFLMSDACRTTERSLDRKLALRYYIQNFTTLLTTNLENNGFLSVLLPMAIEDKPLLDMLIAWSSSHLSLCDDTYRIKALEHRSTALQSFTLSLLSSQDRPEISLACCLVFCSISAILGDTAGWHNHLVGAANIIAGVSSSHSQGLERLSNDYEGRWLLRNFAYHDILMSVTSDCSPLIPGRYWISEAKSAIDSYFGLASEPMALLSKISSLNGDMLRQRDGSIDSRDTNSVSPFSDGLTPPSPASLFTDRAHEIETALQTWVCPESNDPCLIHLAEAYRSAATIYLLRLL